MSEPDIDGAWGVAIVRSVADGVHPNLRSIANHLGVDPEKIRYPFTVLSLNGAFIRGRIYRDRDALNAEPYDQLAWGYYAGLACGATGNVIQIQRRDPYNKGWRNRS